MIVKSHLSKVIWNLQTHLTNLLQKIFYLQMKLILHRLETFYMICVLINSVAFKLCTYFYFKGVQQGTVFGPYLFFM